MKRNDYLIREIETEISRLFKLEFELITEVYAKNESLKHLFGFDLRSSFKYIDKNGLNAIDENKLCEFIQNNLKFVPINDAKLLLKRMDFDKDNKINFSDFQFFMNLGKDIRLNNYIKLSRLNYSLPSFDKTNKMNNFNNRSHFRDFYGEENNINNTFFNWSRNENINIILEKEKILFDDFRKSGCHSKVESATDGLSSNLKISVENTKPYIEVKKNKENNIVQQAGKIFIKDLFFNLIGN